MMSKTLLWYTEVIALIFC